MKIKTNFTTILFYVVSAIAYFIILFGRANPIISLLLLFIFSISVYMGSFYLQKENKNYTEKVMKITFLILFVAYSVYTISLLFTNIYFGRDEILEAGINLIPFKTIFLFLASANEHTLPLSAIITNLVGNLIAFTPLSFYLPLFFKRTRKFWFHILVVTLIIVIIEILQLLLKCGSCDIDDIILNVLGVTISYPIFNNKKSINIIKKLTMF